MNNHAKALVRHISPYPERIALRDTLPSMGTIKTDPIVGIPVSERVIDCITSHTDEYEFEISDPFIFPAPTSIGFRGLIKGSIAAILGISLCLFFWAIIFVFFYYLWMAVF